MVLKYKKVVTYLCEKMYALKIPIVIFLIE